MNENKENKENNKYYIPNKLSTQQTTITANSMNPKVEVMVVLSGCKFITINVTM